MFWDFNIAVILLTSFYFTVLRGRIKLRWARAFLLLIAPLAALLAFVDVPILEPVMIAPQMEALAVLSSVELTETIEYVEPQISLQEVLLCAYWIGFVAIFIYIVFSTVNFALLLRCSRHMPGTDQSIRFTLWPLSGVSFFSTIIIGYRYKGSEQLATIVAHEKIHARKLHSLDIVYYWLLRAVLWFNPAVWLSARALREVHEAQADRNVIKQGFSPSEYIETLLRAEAGLDYLPTNYLSYLKTKNRIKMIAQKKPRHTALRLMLALPLVGGMAAFMSFTHPVVEFMPAREALSIDVAQDNPEDMKYRKGIVTIQGKDTIYMLPVNGGFIRKSEAEAIKASDIEVLSVDNGVITIFTGQKTEHNTILVNIVNPTNIRVTDVKEYLRKIGARKVNYEGLHGEVKIDTGEKSSINSNVKGDSVKITYAFTQSTKSGASQVQPKTVTIDDLCRMNPHDIKVIMINDSERIVIIERTRDEKTNNSIDVSMKQSTPVELLNKVKDWMRANGALKVSYMIVDKKEETSSVRVTTKDRYVNNKTDYDSLKQRIIMVENSSSGNPLILVDGKEEAKGMDAVKTDDIESFAVIKGENAIKIYGERAKDGVILITTKSGQSEAEK